MLEKRPIVISAGIFLLLLALTIAGFRWDARVMDILYVKPHGLIPVMKMFTLYGSWFVLVPAVILGLLFAYSHFKGEFGLRLGIAAASAALASEVMKRVIARTRPGVLHQIYASGSSFPSGHALDSAVVYPMFALMILALTPRFKNWTIILFALPLFIGWSRVYLGVHWPSDVLGGWGIGLIIVGLTAAGKPATQPQAHADVTAAEQR